MVKLPANYGIKRDAANMHRKPIADFGRDEYVRAPKLVVKNSIPQMIPQSYVNLTNTGSRMRTMPTEMSPPIRVPMRYEDEGASPIINYNYNCTNDFSPNKYPNPRDDSAYVPIKSTKASKPREVSVKPKKKSKKSKQVGGLKKSGISSRNSRAYQSDYDSNVTGPYEETKFRPPRLSSVENYSDNDNTSFACSVERRPNLGSCENISRDSGSVASSPNLKKENSWKKRKSVEPLRSSLEASVERLKRKKRPEVAVISTQTYESPPRTPHDWEEVPIGGSVVSPPKEN